MVHRQLILLSAMAGPLLAVAPAVAHSDRATTPRVVQPGRRTSWRHLMTIRHADLCWHVYSRSRTSRAQWADLARLYLRIVRLPRPAALDRQTYRRKRRGAALAAVRCWMQAAGLEGGAGELPHPAKTAEEEARRPQPIPANVRRLLAALRTQATHTPRVEHQPEIQYNRCYIYAFYHHYKRALPLCRGLARRYRRARPRLARRAAAWAMRMLVLRRRYRELHRLIELLLRDAAPTRERWVRPGLMAARIQPAGFRLGTGR